MPDSALSDLIAAPIAGYWGDDQQGMDATVVCRVVRNGDVSKDGRIDASDLPLRWFSQQELDKAHVRGTDAILVSSGAYTGNVGRVSIGEVREPVIASNFVRRLRPIDGADPAWLFHLLRSSVVQRHVWPHTGGSAIPNLGSSFYRGVRIPVVPNPSEQRRIAQILDTVDEAIRGTEQVMAKLQQMKQGLLHDLLTRGIDEKGELRDPDRHPEQFKDSPLGRLPKNWAVQQVGDLLAPVAPAMRSGPFGSALLKEELVSHGVPLLGIENVHVERFERAFTRFVTPRKAAELSRYLVRPGDVMITIMGTVGRCAVVPNDIGPALSSKHVWTLTFDRARYLPSLACLQVNFAPWVAKHFSRDEQGGIMSAIRSDTVRTAQLVVPPLPEQQFIESILGSVQRRLSTEEAHLQKLRLLKHGLVDDLLTGRVRVPIPENPTP